jgi:hypothetical protein
MRSRHPTPAAPESVRLRVAAWQAAAAGALVLWSLTYLGRRLLEARAAAGSPLGDFALEGVLLALVWLAAVLAVCFAASAALDPSSSGPNDPRPAPVAAARVRRAHQTCPARRGTYAPVLVKRQSAPASCPPRRRAPASAGWSCVPTRLEGVRESRRRRLDVLE